jgi:hypothetical protein
MHQNTRQKTIAALSAVVGALVVGGFPAHAQSESTNATKLEQENQELRQRLDKLELLMEKEGLKPSGSAASADPPVAAMTSVSISGFVEASYFSDLADTHDNHPPGYLWNTSLNSFTLNKFKLTLASPAVNKDKWDAAYRTSFIWGSDAPVVDTGSTAGGVAAGNGFSWIREAYLELNVPIGTGLDLRAGDLISLLNYESGDGGAANDNFSQSYAWYYTGNPPNVGIQAGYDFTDWIGIKLRLQNGLYSGPVSIGGKTFIGGLYLKPIQNLWVDLLGFAGHQDISAPPVAPGGWDIAGGSILAGYTINTNWNLAVGNEDDYFHYTIPGGSGDFWSVSCWLGADMCPKVRLALRAEYLCDPSGFGTYFNSPPPGADAAFPGTFPGEGQDLEEVTLTLVYKPVPTVKVQPEIRWNHSNYASGFGPADESKKDQIIVGMGVSYLF